MRAWVAGLALLAAPSLGHAQGERTFSNTGFTWMVGFGKGSLTLDCSLCVESPKVGALGLIGRVGWNVRQNLVLGVDGIIWEKAQDLNGDGENEDVNFMYGGATLVFYPHEFRQYFLKAGVGLGMSKARLDVPSFGDRDVEATALTFAIGTGYDFHVGRGFSVTPYIDYMPGLNGKADLDGASSDVKLKSSMLIWGLQIVVH
jgi:hypothetical protein